MYVWKKQKRKTKADEESSGTFLMKIDDLVKFRFLHNPWLLNGLVLPHIIFVSDLVFVPKWNERRL